jgi:subtilisin family serine protease
MAFLNGLIGFATTRAPMPMWLFLPSYVALKSVCRRSTRPCRCSNFGATTVHVAAPGTSIVSTSLFPDWNNKSEYYVRKTGTSMAAPCVASAAALAIAISRGVLTNVQVSQRDGCVCNGPAGGAECAVWYYAVCHTLPR